MRTPHTQPLAEWTSHLSAVWLMINTTHTNKFSDRPNTLEYQVGDGGGAQEEPYISVRSAYVRSGNPRTGNGLSGLAVPASVNETPIDVSPEAEDAPSPGRGSGEDDTDPLWSITIGAEDNSGDSSEDNPSESEDEGSLFSDYGEADSFSDPKRKQTNRKVKNAPRRRPGLRVASLNMRGRQKDSKDKMRMVVDWLRVNRIAILALQETHLMEDSINKLNEKYRHLSFYGSGLTTSSGGIMFIVSEGAEDPQRTQFKCFEQGRTGMLSLKYGEQELNIVNVYMPNDKPQQKETLTKLRRDLRNSVDITESELLIVGDWNFVEDKIDRSPQHHDDRRVTNEMTKLKATLDLIDGWRRENPLTRSFTWEGSAGNERKKIFSRIDRIYAPLKTWELTNEYKIISCDISDHDGVSVTIRNASEPDTGRGEPKLNLNILNHPIFKSEADKQIVKLEKRMKKYEKTAARKDTPEKRQELMKARANFNPQSLWQNYKEKILTASTKATLARRTEITKIRRQAEKAIKKAERDLRDCLPEMEDLHRKILSDKKKVLNDYDEEARKIRAYLNDGKWFKCSEKMSKQWFSLNKSRSANTTIKSLFKTGTQEETENAPEMLEVAREYHQQLQAEPPLTDDRERAIDAILAKTKSKLNRDEATEMEKLVSFNEAMGVVRRAPNGKAPGPDGIQNEFWKTEVKWREKQKSDKKHQPGDTTLWVRPCIVAMMTKVFNDIETFGPINAKFSEARMSLLYKKKDKREIQNYRPITLLNTDYKSYTKIIANRLRVVAPKLIHRDQAGFMPRRSIYDQTKIVELMIKWCENTSSKGLIICLDQEKAYDRIDLNYLWRVLRKNGFPEPFIIKIRHLYTSASTAIRINGFVSDLFDVRRGVRQGDPMSCLLYNLAIEPLIEYIRSSSLRGFKINKDLQKVIVKVYADDTTVFLGPEDDPNTLQDCLNLFCKASTARFNDLKTEIIPLGSVEDRNETIQSREFNGWRIADEIHLAQEGEAIRILGSWQGNGINIQSKWNDIIERQLKTMRHWNHLYPSVAGRVLIAKALVISLAYYLMTVNGIHRNTLSTMEKNIRNFIWNGKKGQMAWERAILPVEAGGIGAPSVKIRYETIKIDWLKRWWNPGHERPDWAWVANELVYQSAQQKPEIPRATISEWVSQTWLAKTRSARLTTSMKEMLEAAQKYNVSLSVMRAPTSLRLDMPAFHHPFARNRNLRMNSKTMRCLQDVHEARTVRDLIQMTSAELPAPPATCIHIAQNGQGCRKKAKELLNRIIDQWHPERETPQRHTLWHTPRRLEKYKEADPVTTMVEYNPDTRTLHSALGGVRIFGKWPGHKSRRKDPYTREREPPRTDLRPGPNAEKVKISTDGSATRNGWEDAAAGIGVFYDNGSERNISLRLTSQEKGLASNSRAELAAILEALKQNNTDDLEIESDSLSSLRAICNQLDRYEDLNWSGVKNADILKGILIRLRSRSAKTSFKWVKGHEFNYGNIKADELADTGREGDPTVTQDEDEWIDNHPALQDGARLQALSTKHIYKALLHWHTRGMAPILHQEILEDAKSKVEAFTGLRPTNEKLLKGVKTLGVPPRIKDHLRCLLTSKIKCGAFWDRIPGCAERAMCSPCRKRGVDALENEQHMWLDCENNGQARAWETARSAWSKTTDRDWPDVSVGLIRGAPALSFEHDYTKDSERLRILLVLTIWAIWKTRNKCAINDQEIAPTEASETLKELL